MCIGSTNGVFIQRDMELAPKLAPWAPRVLTSSFDQIVCRPRVYRRKSS